MSGQGSGIGPGEDVKAKFREALAKKQNKAGHGSADESDHSKVHGQHGPETTAQQQMFRRKSG